MGEYSFLDHMFVLNCGLLSIACSIYIGVTIFIVISVLLMAFYTIIFAVSGWIEYRDRRAAKRLLSQKNQ